jgi:hypothetical protein
MNIIELFNTVLVWAVIIFIGYFGYKAYKLREKCTNKEGWMSCYWDELRGITYTGT